MRMVWLMSGWCGSHEASTEEPVTTGRWNSPDPLVVVESRPPCFFQAQ